MRSQWSSSPSRSSAQLLTYWLRNFLCFMDSADRLKLCIYMLCLLYICIYAVKSINYLLTLFLLKFFPKFCPHKKHFFVFLLTTTRSMIARFKCQNGNLCGSLFLLYLIFFIGWFSSKNSKSIDIYWYACTWMNKCYL